MDKTIFDYDMLVALGVTLSFSRSDSVEMSQKFPLTKEFNGDLYVQWKCIDIASCLKSSLTNCSRSMQVVHSNLA